MNQARVLYHMVRADFLERVRRYSFLLTLAFAAYLAWGAATGRVVLRLDEYRGVFNSAWLGSMMTVVGTMFISLVGFYIVKNAILRDEQTRVGRILASTPMSRLLYTLAKSLSNFAVLTLMIAVLAMTALLMQFTHAEDTHYHLGTLLAPFLWVGIPAMAVTAAVAVLFETLPILRGGVGNVIYVFVWVGALAVSDKKGIDDYAGFFVIAHSMQTALKKVNPAYNNDFALNIGDSALVTKRFLWTGVDWTAAIIWHRMLWVLIALAIAGVASLFFHRFDPARAWSLRRKKPAAPASANGDALAAGPAAEGRALGTSGGHLTPLGPEARENRFWQLVVSELRLMLQGQRWWWYVVALGLLIASVASPTLEARSVVIAVAWLWPTLVWSQMGARESRFATESLIFSSARTLNRQLPAVWVAGFIVTMLTGGGYGIRLLTSTDWRGLLAWFAGALFIPSLALALGTLSGTSKPFEATYTVWWYLGPLNHAPGFDFVGSVAATRNPLFYVASSAVLMTAAYFGRRVRMAYV
jgi:arginine exporter protein ArgO